MQAVAQGMQAVAQVMKAVAQVMKAAGLHEGGCVTYCMGIILQCCNNANNSKGIGCTPYAQTPIKT